MTDKAKQLGDEIVSPCILRQTGDNSFRIATPVDINRGVYLVSNYGLTKREYFAAMAMQEMCVGNMSWQGIAIDPKIISSESLKIADSLLEELSKTE